MSKKPMRVFEGTMAPHEPFWRLINADESETGEPEIEFYGYISEYSWWEDDISPAKFKADLLNLGKGGPVTVRINSGGGEVYAASVIRAMLMDYPGRVTSRIDGLCASAATLVAMAGDVVKMQDSGFFMIHDPWVSTWGTAEELKDTVKFLETIKQGIIESYQSKTTLGFEQLDRMMKAETWMTAQEAREMGFVDEVITSPAKKINPAQSAAVMNCLRTYMNVPPALLSSERGLAFTENLRTTGDLLTREEIIEREAQSLRDYLNVFG